MPDPNFVLLYVENPQASEPFYTQLLGHKAVQSSTTFVLFALASGVRLGLWSKHAAEPPPGPVGGGELAFAVGNANAVDSLHREWHRRGMTIVQRPTKMDLGRTFVALDPDGHRLRVFAPT